MARVPDKLGYKGKAWRVWISTPTSLGRWLIHTPGAEYPHKMFILSHLRDVPKVPPAIKVYDGAEYEMVILSLSPASATDPDTRTGFTFLAPPEVAIQFHGVSDQDAVRMMGMLVDSVLSGELIPEEDFQTVWGPHVQELASRFQRKHFAAS